jgi:hypothetical protein
MQNVSQISAAAKRIVRYAHLHGMPGHAILTPTCEALFVDYEQNPRNSRRNTLPTERIDGPLVMRHEYLTCALIELMQIPQTSSCSDGVFHGPPEAFDGIEVVATVGW